MTPGEMSARDLQDATGMSYRQINEWDERGALPHDRDSDRSWRRFSPNQVFQLMICRELQQRFGVPVEKLKYVIEFMSQEEANHLRATIDMMAILGLEVWLLTDFEETFILHSEAEFLDLMQLGFFGGEKPAGYTFLKVSPLANRLAEQLIGERFESHRRGFDFMNAGSPGPLTDGEREVLTAIRSGDYEAVEVQLANGDVRTIRTTSHLDVDSNIRDLIESKDYQKVTITRRGGKTVSVTRETTEKP